MSNFRDDARLWSIAALGLDNGGRESGGRRSANAATAAAGSVDLPAGMSWPPPLFCPRTDERLSSFKARRRSE